MQKRLFKSIDVFLPSQFTEYADVPILYRARVIIATNLLSLLATVLVLITYICINASSFIIIDLFLIILGLLGHFLFIKKRLQVHGRNLLVGAFIQVSFITGLIYTIAFASHGSGFFGLVWLIPVFLMIAFFFQIRSSFYIALSNLIVFWIISFYKFDQFLDPLKNLPNFINLFYVFLTLVIIYTYLISYLYVLLNEELQKEVIKQRDLLVESAKFQSLGQMASNLAHDINNPLFTIQGKLHQMRNLLSRDQLDLDKCDQIVENVENTILKLSLMVKGITTFAREGRGDHMISIGVAELIEGNLALAIDRIKNLGIELEMQIHPSAVIICYPSFISQVILNLINNAIDAIESSQIKKILVQAFVENEWIYIIIKDSGPGIPKEFEKKVFEKFFTTKTIGKGTGLGLSISKGLVEVHNGDLKYQRVDNYTQFIVRLPSYE